MEHNFNTLNSLGGTKQNSRDERFRSKLYLKSQNESYSLNKT